MLHPADEIACDAQWAAEPYVEEEMNGEAILSEGTLNRVKTLDVMVLGLLRTFHTTLPKGADFYQAVTTAYEDSIGGQIVAAAKTRVKLASVMGLETYLRHQIGEVEELVALPWSKIEEMQSFYQTLYASYADFLATNDRGFKDRIDFAAKCLTDGIASRCHMQSRNALKVLNDEFGDLSDRYNDLVSDIYE